MKKIILTEKGEQLLQEANEKWFPDGEEAFNDYHADIDESTRSLFDLGMYVESCYVENEFDTVEKFINDIIFEGEEYQDIEVAKIEVPRKINWGFEQGIIEIQNI